METHNTVSPQEKETALERFAHRAAHNIGSTASLAVHTAFFVGIFSLHWFGLGIEQILLILTTLVSLEAIYLAIFIQMTVNRQAEGLSAVQQDIEDIQEDVEEISEDIEGIQEEVKEIGDDVEEISEDIEGIQEDVEEISDEIVEDEKEEETEHIKTNLKLQKIEDTLHQLFKDIEALKK